MKVGLMEIITKSFVLLAMLLCVASATNVDAAFQASDSTYHFNTDMQLTTDFAVSTGGQNIQSGSSLCAGSVVSITPTFSAKWASSSLDIVSYYPRCGAAYCPAMIPSSGISYGKDIHWLDSTTFDTQKSYGDNNDITTNTAFYSLSSFYNEPVTYNNVTGLFVPNMEGGANVFCDGDLQVKDGNTVITTTPLPSIGPVDITLSASGTHSISTSFTNVNCFAALVKHPINLDDNPTWFRFYYFTHNAPAISANSVGTKTIIITVNSNGTGNCALAQTEIDSSSATGTPGLSVVHVTVKNNGDPVTMNDVSSSDPGFTVSPFPTTTCDVLGFPSSLCPSDNGFNEVIPSGGSKDVYVLMQNNGGTGTTLIFSSTVGASSSCSGGSSGGACNFTADLSGPASCTIVPSSLTYGTDEVAKFSVSCQDFTGNTIPCTGDNWFWTGISGDFIEKDNTQALAYPTSAPGTSGTLEFQPASGTAACYSDIDVVTPTYVCKFTPPNADLNYSQSQPFVLSCLVNGTSETPDTTTYITHNGLQGTLSNQSNSGVTYTAPNFDTNGDLIGFGQFDSAPSPILGAVADAPITVTNGSTGGNQTNTTTNTTGNCPACSRSGDTNWCQMADDLINAFTGYSGWIGLKCGQYGNETCDQATWNVDPSSAATFSDPSSPTGVTITITGAKGTTGTITVSVNGKSDQTCTRGFAVGDRACWEIS